MHTYHIYIYTIYVNIYIYTLYTYIHTYIYNYPQAGGASQRFIMSPIL